METPCRRGTLSPCNNLCSDRARKRRTGKNGPRQPPARTFNSPNEPLPSDGRSSKGDTFISAVNCCRATRGWPVGLGKKDIGRSTRNTGRKKAGAFSRAEEGLERGGPLSLLEMDFSYKAGGRKTVGPAGGVYEEPGRGERRAEQKIERWKR